MREDSPLHGENEVEILHHDHSVMRAACATIISYIRQRMRTLSSLIYLMLPQETGVDYWRSISRIYEWKMIGANMGAKGRYIQGRAIKGKWKRKASSEFKANRSHPLFGLSSVTLPYHRTILFSLLVTRHSNSYICNTSLTILQLEIPIQS